MWRRGHRSYYAYVPAAPDPLSLSFPVCLGQTGTHSFLALFCSVFSSGNVDGAVLSAPESWALV